ncbi:MAG: hypothetical protein PHP45_02325 [Elusimicrobiales bacterium]|nr:hypothetical protein [Elusimicrobiales bacterium]
MQQHDNLYLPVTESKTDLESYSKKLAGLFGIPKQTDRIQAIMEKLYHKHYCQRPFTGQGLALSLEEAFCNLGRTQALDLFEKSDLDMLANHVSLIRNWAGGLEPLYTRKELAAEIREFDNFYDEKRDSLLAYGYPYAYFAIDSFFIKLTFLNPTLDPGWKVQGKNNPFADSLNQWENFGALKFSHEESTFLEDSRIKLHHIKSELCLLFYHALEHNEHTPQTLCDKAGQIIAKHLNRDEANRLLHLEQRYAGLFQYKACVMNDQVGKQEKFLLDIGSGGLHAMMDAVLFVAEELETSRLDKTKTILTALLQGRELSSYYLLWQTMDPNELKKLNKFLDGNSDYFSTMAKYGKHFKLLLMNGIKKHITIPVAVKKEHAEKISHAAKHLEQGGELRLGEIAYTATGTKRAKPQKLKEKATLDAIIPGKFKVHITGLKNPKQQIFIDGREVQLSEAGFLLFLRLAVARKEGKDGMVVFKNEKLVPHLSHQKVKRLWEDLAYKLKNDAKIIGNDSSGGYCLNTTASRIKINIQRLRKQSDGLIDAILGLLGDTAR